MDGMRNCEAAQSVFSANFPAAIEGNETQKKAPLSMA